jgi:hypothetical protein
MNSVMDLAERARERPNQRSTRPSLSAAQSARRVLLANDDGDSVAYCEQTLTAHRCLVETTLTAEDPRRYLELVTRTL